MKADDLFERVFKTTLGVRAQGARREQAVLRIADVARFGSNQSEKESVLAES